MNPRDSYCPYYNNEPKKQYQLVVMHEDGMTYFVGRLYDFEGIQKAVKELRELYAKHGITHHVGYREV